MITTIAFDFGGVLTKGKYTKAILDSIGGTFANAPPDRYRAFDRLVGLMDQNRSNSAQFVKEVNETFGTQFTPEEMRDVFRKALSFNPDAVAYAKQLSKKYRVQLWSNNNEMTTDILRKEHKDVLSSFEKIYFSHEMKDRKPSRVFFEEILEDSNLAPEECIFIDDKENNILAAKELGIHAVLFKTVEKLKKDLSTLGIKG